MSIRATPPSPEQPTPYTPAGPTEPLIFEKFEGINTTTTRAGVDDKEAYWIDGFMPLGPYRNLRTMYGLSAALFTTPTTSIVFKSFINIGTTPYCLVFCAGGEIYAVNTNTGGYSLLASSGTIQNPSPSNIGVAQYGAQYAIIVARQTNGYFIWDGTTFYTPGTSAFGGTVPLAISGTAVEIYEGRVWIANGGVVTFSAPGSIVDFSSADGGGNFTSSDSFLRVQFSSLKQTNGFLYLIGDSSVNYISSVQTAGSPVVTTFTNQNADPEVGSPWANTVEVFNRNILFANAFGAHVSYGGAVTKISEKLDGVYQTLYPNFGNLSPSGAKAIIFGKKCYVLLLPIIDPVTGQQVNKLFLWNSKIWWATNQDLSLIFITAQEFNSIITAWGTDGNAIYQLFAQPSSFTKTAVSKLWDAPGGYQFLKSASRLWGVVQYYSQVNPDIEVSIDNENGSNLQQLFNFGPLLLTWSNPFGAMTWSNPQGAMTWYNFTSTAVAVFQPTAVSQVGNFTGLTLQTRAADLAIISVMFWDNIAGYRG